MGERSCGGCTACCKTHPIVELDNPARVWCPECDIAKGCKIYGNHPQGCRDFACQWLLGGGLESERPDKVKIVVDYLVLPIFGETTMVHEVTEGALENPFAQRVLKRLIQMGKPVCFLPIVGGNTLYLPRTGAMLYKNFGRLNDRETTIVYL